MKKIYTKIGRAFFSLLLPFMIVIGWDLITTYGDKPTSIMPTLGMIGRAFCTMVKSGQLQEDLLVSFTRIIKGYILAVVLGSVLGIVMGMIKGVKNFFYLTLTSIRQIPMMAWVPLVILWCGIGEMSKIVIIVIAAFFPIMVNTLQGIERTPQNYLELARLYNLNKWETFVKVYLPHALPSMLVGLKLGISSAWMAVVGAEMIAASSGIGFRMQDSRSKMRADSLLVCMLVVGLIGILMDKGLVCLFGKLTPWDKNENGENR